MKQEEKSKGFWNWLLVVLQILFICFVTAALISEASDYIHKQAEIEDIKSMIKNLEYLEYCNDNNNHSSYIYRSFFNSRKDVLTCFNDDLNILELKGSKLEILNLNINIKQEEKLCLLNYTEYC